MTTPAGTPPASKQTDETVSKVRSESLPTEPLEMRLADLQIALDSLRQSSAADPFMSHVKRVLLLLGAEATDHIIRRLDYQIAARK